MDLSKLRRDPAKVKANLIETPDGQLIAKAPCSIVIPARFAERELATLEPQVYTIGIYALILEDGSYAVSTVPAMMRFTPIDVVPIKFGEEEYLQFLFPKGSVISDELRLRVENTVVYYIYNELIAKGNVPWYLEYEDFGKLFAEAPKFAGVTVGANHAIFEMVISAISRDPKDKTKYWRHADRDGQPTVVPLRSVIYGPTSTLSRIMGAYFKEGITASLVNPSEKVEDIEDLLRR